MRSAPGAVRASTAPGVEHICNEVDRPKWKPLELESDEGGDAVALAQLHNAHPLRLSPQHRHFL